MEERPAPKASTLNRKGELLNRQSSTLKKKQQEQAMRDSVSDFEKPIPMEEEHSGDEIKGDGESTALKKKGTGTANDHQTSTLKKKKQEEPMRDDISDFEKPVVYEERQEVTTNEGPSNSTLKKKLTTQNNRQSTITNNNSTTNGNDKNGLRDSVSDFERPIADDNLVPTAVEEVKSSSTTAVAGKKAVAANSNLKTVNKPALKKSTTSLKSVSKPTGKDTQQPASKSSLSTTKNTKTAKGKPELVAAKKPVGVAKSGEELNDETRTAAGGAKKAALPKRPAASQVQKRQK